MHQSSKSQILSGIINFITHVQTTLQTHKYNRHRQRMMHMYQIAYHHHHPELHVIEHILSLKATNNLITRARLNM